jgi:hypothetical protein
MCRSVPWLLTCMGDCARTFHDRGNGLHEQYRAYKKTSPPLFFHGIDLSCRPVGFAGAGEQLNAE